MDTVNSTALREHISRYKRAGASIAFVPTMGNLHEGHLSLVRRGSQMADVVVVSIFVNPMQFGPNEDLDSYPRTLADDIEKLTTTDTQLVFTPTVDEIYPEGIDAHTQVAVPHLTNVLCGASRPGHFDGVTTVVCKLLNLVSPDIAVFGEKDLQQLLIIQKMVRDLALPVQIEGVPTARAEDGLALSSRNGYLSPEHRTAAAQLYAQLSSLADLINSGHRDFPGLCQHAAEQLAQSGFDIDYLEARRPVDLALAQPDDDELALFVAARLGSTRLIDNIRVKLTTGTPR